MESNTPEHISAKAKEVTLNLFACKITQLLFITFIYQQHEI